MILYLNGQGIEVDVDPRRTLLELLREELDFTGTKEGCGRGHCGSCAVLVDGKYALACRLPLARLIDRQVTTIEGLGKPDNLHPLQWAFIQTGAVQCGFCNPGMIIAAQALLAKNPSPTRQQVISGMRRNLCRCTGYIKIVEAVLLAAAVLRGEREQTDLLQPGREGNLPLIGSVEKVCGLTRYAADMKMPGMLHAQVLRSPHPHAEILTLDPSAALGAAGVDSIVTHKEVPGANRTGPVVKDQPILAEDRVRYQGEPLAALAASSVSAAKKALGHIRVDYRPLACVGKPEEAFLSNAPAIHPQGNLLFSRRIVKGDINEGFARADAVVENTYTTPFNEHAYLEPEAGIAYIDEEGRVTVASCCQNPHYLRRELAGILGLPDERVRVIQTPTGGGFGGKLEMSVQGVLALLTQNSGRPVKYVYSREESFQSSGKRHPFVMKYRTGATRDGKLTALEVNMAANTGAYASFGSGVLTRAAIHATGPYEVPNVFIQGRLAYTNNPVCCAMRGFGAPQVNFALESQLDLLADSLKIDPLEFRLINAMGEGAVTATGQPLAGPVTIRRALEELKPFCESWKVSSVHRASGESGLGIAGMWFGIGKTSVDNKSEVCLKLTREGRVEVLAAAADIGQGSRTILAQIVAAELDLPLEDISVSDADTALAPDADFTCASRQTYFTGGAARQGAERLKESIIDQAARLLQCSAEKLSLKRGSVVGPGGRISLKELAGKWLKPGASFKVMGDFSLPITGQLDAETGQGVPYPTYTFGAQLADVEVDRRNGRAKVRRVVAVQDVGKAINPKSVEGQIEGGVVMGIGLALKEEFIPGQTKNFRDYKIPTFADMPEITCIMIEEGDPYGPFGAKGIGESALMPIVPAVANAIQRACGVRVFDLPASSERIMSGLNRRT
jgi:CO/xanthine dehydrogenase Mo-binding subunit/aerobic-type carbon monoxide dehydrogenase small subunit (CoxS/CutS family)